MGKKYFWASVHHMMDTEFVITWFGYYVKLASKPGAVPGGLVPPHAHGVV